MATTTADIDAELDGSEVQEPRVRRRRGPLIVIAMLVLALGGTAGWWFTRGAEADAKAKHEEAQPELPPVYLPLEPITVNLQPEVGDQFLQVDINLKVADEKAVEKLKSRMPEIRNHLLMLLSSKHASEVVSLEGKNRLRGEILHDLIRVIDPAAARAADEAAKKEAQAAAQRQADAAALAAASATAAASAAPAAGSGAAAEAAPPPAAAAKPEPEHAKPEKLAEAAIPKDSPILDVLFTSFIVQ